MRRNWAFLCVSVILCANAVCPCSIGAQQVAAHPDMPLAPVRKRIDAGQFSDAEQELRVLLDHQPEEIEAHFLLGYVLFREHQAVKSIAEYNIAAHLRTPSAEEWITIASDYILLKDLGDAEKWLRLAAAHEPSNAAVWYLLGRTQYNEDHNEDAAHSFARCLELRPRDVRAEYNLGLAEEKLGRQAEATAAYRTAIAWQDTLVERDPQPYLDLGTLLLHEAKPAEALGPLQEAVRFGPRNAFAHQQLGVAFEALGRFDDAIALLQQAAVLSPEAEQPHFFLGRIFRRLGRSSKAAAEFATVSKLIGSRSGTATPNTDGQP